MTDDAKVLAFVLAGGRGTRLHPLTAEQAKPALPLAEGRRIMDFVLSNLVRSRIEPIYVLAQYKPRSLIEHVESYWAQCLGSEAPLVSVVLAGRDGNAAPFRGTADSVHRNLDLVARHQPDLVAVFAADHVYRMDVRQMVRFHQQRDADVTLAAVPVPIEQASSFGILRTGPTGELLEFREKPECPDPFPGDPTRAFASMGNYLFRPGTLVELLETAMRRDGVDFGVDILTQLPEHCRAFVYDFTTNAIPGLQPYEEHAYWRDVGTPDAYHAAQRDVQRAVAAIRTRQSRMADLR